MTEPTSSFVMTGYARPLASLKAEDLASQLGLSFFRAASADLAEVTAAASGATSTLILGVGDTTFDASVASALGLPLVIVADDDAPVARANAAREGATVAGVFTGSESAQDVAQAVAGVAATPRVYPATFEAFLLQRAKENRQHIVLPEGEDDRILEAAAILLADDICELTILGDPAAIEARAAELGLDLAGAHLVDHLTSPHAEDFAQTFAELRAKKGVTIEQARETMKDVSYFATMMIYQGLADGMVSGAAHTTAHTIKPSFQIIKTVPEASVVSSVFLMVLPGRLWAFGDCAVNPNPTAEQLGEIAVVSAKTAAQFGIDPRVAILSYSTGTSGAGPDVDRALAAVERAHELDADLKIDGPLQFDSAVDATVAAKKAPESEVAGEANVFIFPDLEAGNIGYKAVQRTSGALAVGPILQGLRKPVNDLSRGATVPDIVNTVAVTAIQAGAL